MHLIYEDLSLNQIASSPVSGAIQMASDERYTIEGPATKSSKFISSIYNADQDLAIFKILVNSTHKYGDEYDYKDVDNATFKLQDDPSELYEVWVGFFPMQKTMNDNGWELNKEGVVNAFKKCSIKLWSNSPSFHYQGFNYNLSQKNASLFPTTIAPRKWNARHGSTLLDKHTYQVVKNLSFYLNQFAQSLLKKVPQNIPLEEPEEERPIEQEQEQPIEQQQVEEPEQNTEPVEMEQEGVPTEEAPKEQEEEPGELMNNIKREATKGYVTPDYNQIWVELGPGVAKAYWAKGGIGFDPKDFIFEVTPKDKQDVESLLYGAKIGPNAKDALKPGLEMAARFCLDAVAHPGKYPHMLQKFNINGKDRKSVDIDIDGPNGKVISKNLDEAVEDEPKKKATFIWGRYNPPTKGHMKAFNIVLETAKKYQTDAYVLTTHSHDQKKNPLSWEQKVNFLSRMVPQGVTVLADPEVTTIFEALVWFYNKKYTDLIIYQDVDAVAQLKIQCEKYNDVQSNHGYYVFNSIQVVSTGDRDPDSNDVNGFSATKARNAAMDGNFEEFQRITADDKELAMEMFEATRDGLGVQESTAIRNELLTYLSETLSIPMYDLALSLKEHSAKELLSLYTSLENYVEGGHAVSGDRIKREYILPTLEKFDPFLQRLIPGVEYRPIGSTGKKPDNGDIDLGVQSDLDLKTITAAFEKEGFKCAPSVGFNQVSVLFPQFDEAGNETDKHVQIDLMLGELNWLSFKYAGFGLGESKYGPIGRVGALAAIMKQLGYGINNQGVFKRDANGKKDPSIPLITNPDEVAGLISSESSEPWTATDLVQPLEYIWDKVKQTFPPDLAENFRAYVDDFLTHQKAPIGLTEMVGKCPVCQGKGTRQKLNGEVVECSYCQGLGKVDELNEKGGANIPHIEDLVYNEGAIGGEKAMRYLGSLFSELQGNTPEEEVTATMKWDGSHFTVFGNNYPGVNGPFVGMKNTFSPKQPQIFQTDEEIDARYGDKPNLANELKISLHYIPQLGIPDGELWCGDFLFTKEDLEQRTDEQGKQWVIFTPNTLTYAVEIDTDLGQRILSSDAGVAFHTIVRGNDLRTAAETKSFGDVDISKLNPVQGLFAVDSNLPSLVGKVTLTEEESYECVGLQNKTSEAFEKCKDFANEVAAKPTLRDLLIRFENYGVGQNFQFGDINKYVEEFLKWLPENYSAKSKIASVQEYFGQTKREEFGNLLMFQAGLVELKNYLIGKLNNLPRVTPFIREPDGSFKLTGQEGFAVSDIDGNIIKLVDRLTFSALNFQQVHESLKEKTTQDQMDKFLAKNNLQTIKKVNSKDGKIRLNVRSTAGIDRNEAADLVAAKLHIHVMKIGDRPVIEDPSLDPFSLQFKPTPGVGNKMGDATARTEQQETATAFALYKLNELGVEASLKELQKLFPDCDKGWHHSITESARAFTKWIGNRKEYIYSRGRTTFPKTAGGDIHDLVKHMATSLGFKSADSWNPSDIYICKSTKLDNIRSVFERIGNSTDSKEEKLQLVNDFLAKALESKTIIGVSLKKVKKAAKVEYGDDPESHILPKLEFISFPINLGTVTVTGVMKDLNGSGDYTVRIGSNSSEVRSVTVEFKKKGAQAALGKATGSPEVAEWFAKYGMHKPNGVDTAKWKTLSPEVLIDFSKKASVVKKMLPGVRYEASDLKDYLAQFSNPKKVTPDQMRTFLNTFQILVYGELFAKAKNDNLLDDLATSWLIASKKNTDTSAPFVKITDF